MKHVVRGLALGAEGFGMPGLFFGGYVERQQELFTIFRILLLDFEFLRNSFSCLADLEVIPVGS